MHRQPVATSATRSAFSRRQFLGRSAVAAGGAMAFAGATGPLCLAAGQELPSKKIVVGVMGTSSASGGGRSTGRGTELAKGFAGLPGAEVAYICDVDSRNVAKAVDAVAAKQGKAPQGVGDFRRILDDKSVDALVIAAPDHWHAPATILACAAGKHVYCEKPASHNPREGEWMVAAAEKHGRVVQLGTQRRSWPGIIEAVAALRAGEIGRVLSAHCLYFAGRPTIGHGKEAPVPEWLDYSLWQGPAPERPFRDNLVHYNWHWFWHWGTGELGNNGVHTLDLARWGLGVDYPRRVTSTGGKYRYDDDQQTPDTNVVAFEFADQFLTWEGRSWAKKSPLDPDYDVRFEGEKGSMAVGAAGYTIHDADGKEKAKGTGASGNDVHLQNFVDAIRGDKKQNAPIAEGVRSTLLCHLGNISYRVGRAVRLDGGTKQIADDAEASALWGREYRKGWEPKV